MALTDTFERTVRDSFVQTMFREYNQRFENKVLKTDVRFHLKILKLTHPRLRHCLWQDPHLNEIRENIKQHYRNNYYPPNIQGELLTFENQARYFWDRRKIDTLVREEWQQVR